MVQPRKEQLKNVLTRHSRFDLQAMPGDLETSVPEATLNPWVTSDEPGGSQEDLPAQAIGAVGPYLIVAGDRVSIQRQSDAFVTIAFTAADITAARIAAAVNLAVGTDIAFSVDGRILFRSDVVGGDSSLVLNDVVVGTFAKMGVVAGAYSGSDAPVRGVVTESLDSRGGYAFLRTLDGKNVVTDCPSVSSVGIVSSPRLRADLPGGIPVHARLTYASGSYAFKYFANMPTDPEVVTVGGDMSLLDATDFVTLTFTPGVPFPSVGSFVFGFPTGPGLTRDQVVDVINEVFSKAVTGAVTAAGWASVSGTVGQPYSFDGERVEVSVDGAAFVAVPLDVTEVTASDVATAFNTVLSGVMTASALVAGNANILLNLITLNADGRTASIEIRNSDGSQGTLEKLGIAAGKYRGPFVAEPSGSDEIRIRGLARGPLSSVTMTGSGTSESRLGFTSGIFIGTAEGEVEVGFPVIDAANPATVQEVTALVPEVLEFGEVDPAVESVIEQFNAKSSGSNLDDRASSGSVAGGGAASLVGQSRGVPDAGKPVVTNALGLVDMSFLRAARDDSYRFFKKLVRGDFSPGVNRVDALVTDVIETPGAEGHGGTNVGLFTVDVDRPDALSSRQFRLRFGKLVSAKVPFAVVEVGIAGAEWLVNGQDTLGDGTAFGNATGAMKLLDANTDAAGLAVGGTRFIPVSSAVANEGDRTLRIMEAEEGALEPMSLFRQVNGRWTTTCGDGVNTFGDFNGDDAIQQAIAYYNSHASTGSLRIRLKQGNYLVNAVNGSVIVPNDEFVIESVEAGAASIRGDGTVDPIIQVAVGGSLTLRDLNVRKTAGTAVGVQMEASTALYMDRVEFLACEVSFRDATKAVVRACEFSMAGIPGTQRPIIEFVMSDGLGPFTNAGHKGFLFEDCRFRGSDNNPTMRISALNSAIPITRIGRIEFVRCDIELQSTTDDGGGSMTGNCGVLELAPNGSDVRAGTDTGVIVDRISYRNCTVKANTNGDTVSCLMHLIPQGNGVAFDGGTEFMGVTRLEIDGGSWLAPAISTLFNPFTVFEVGTVVEASTKADEDGGLFIRDCLMGFGGSPADTGVLQGSATADCDGILFMGPTDAAPTDDVWGAWAIGCRKVRILDTRFVGFSQLADVGAFALRWYDFRMHGCTIERFKFSGPGSARSLFRIRAREHSGIGSGDGGPGIEFKDVEIIGADIVSGSLGTFWSCDPNGADVGKNWMTWDNVKIHGFNIAGTFLSTIMVHCDGFVGDDSEYTGSLRSYRNITIRNCRLDKVGPIFHHATASVGDPVSCNNLRIIGNEARDGGNACILFFNGAPTDQPACDHAEIVNNRIIGYVGYGVLFGQDHWSSTGLGSGSGHIIMTGNQLSNNNGGPTTVQAYVSCFVFNPFDPMRIQGQIRDNWLHGIQDPSDLGRLKLDAVEGGLDDVAGSNAPANHSITECPLRGADTGHSTAGTDEYYHSNTVLMTKNSGVLETP